MAERTGSRAAEKDHRLCITAPTLHCAGWVTIILGVLLILTLVPSAANDDHPLYLTEGWEKGPKERMRVCKGLVDCPAHSRRSV